MAIRLEDQQALATFRQRLAAAAKKVENGISSVNEGNTIPSPSNLKPNIFRELLPKSQTLGEGDA